MSDDPSAPSGPCRVVDHAPELCTRRAGDGLALVLQRGAQPAVALGLPGAGLGYAGLPGGVAVELDTWADADARDPGDNHVAVLTRGAATLRCEGRAGNVTAPPVSLLTHFTAPPPQVRPRQRGRQRAERRRLE